MTRMGLRGTATVVCYRVAAEYAEGEELISKFQGEVIASTC